MKAASELGSVVESLTEDDAGRRWVDLARDPKAVQRLGEVVADACSALEVEAVASWWDPDDTVLAHVVARALEVPRLWMDDPRGLLTLGDAPVAGTRVLLVGVAFVPGRSVDVSVSSLRGMGCAVAGVVELLTEDGPALTRWD
jgi:hypothetical protein